MHHDELWQIYAPNGEPIEGEGWDSRLGNPGPGSDVIIGVATVLLYRRNDAGELEVLWQRRSEKVDRFPGDYDVSAGGHINLGESVVDAAIRELYEEIGARVMPEDLHFVTSMEVSPNRFIKGAFLVDWTGREEDFAFNDEEVSEVKWVPFVEMEEFRQKYAKPTLKGKRLDFESIEEWFRRHGDL